MWKLFAVAGIVVASAEAVGADPIAKAPPMSYKEIADIPIADCTANQVMGWIWEDSLRRDAEGIPQRQKDLQTMLDITEKLPKIDVPVGQMMNHEQSAEFAQIEARNSIHFLQHLAETRLQRDSLLVIYAVETIDKIRRGEADIKAQYDAEGNGAALVGLLRKVMASDEPEISDPVRPTECSVDMAIFLLSQASFQKMQEIASTPEFQQYQTLRTQYKITQGPIDPKVLPSPDREKAIWLEKAVAEPMRLEFQAATDLGHLRAYARVSRAEYEALLQDVAIGLGDKKYSYETHAKAMYAAADTPNKHAVDAWIVIENNVPSEATKETQALNQHMEEYYKEEKEKKDAQAAAH